MTIQEKEQKQKEIQDQAYNAWLVAGGRGLLQIATGVGKTRVALLSLIMRDTTPGTSVLITAPDLFILNSWKLEFEKWGVDIEDYNVTLATIQSAHKWRDKYFDYYISDEVHGTLSEEYSKIYLHNSFGRVMALSATVNRTHQNFLAQFDIPLIFTYNINQAVADGIVSPFKINIIECLISSESEENKLRYKQFEHRAKEAELNNHNDKFLHRQTQAFMFGLPTRVKSAQKLRSLLLDANKRVLTFSNSIKALTEVTPHAIYSQKGFSKERKIANKLFFDMFQKGDINDLGSFKMLKQGVNLTNLNAMIVMSYFMTERDLIQRLGRVIRWEEGKIADIYIFCFVDTIEKQWLESTLRNIDPSLISYLYNDLL